MAETTPKKKNLSPETEAIVKRLKSEGDLVRNSGTNSIKAITINLDKFTDAFAAIQISSEQTAKVLTDSWQGNEALLQNIDESLVGLDETEKKAELARRAQAKTDAIANKENKSEGMFAAKTFQKNLMGGFKGLKDGFMAIKKDPWGTLLSIGKWAIIIPVLAGAVTGLLDKLFGEGTVQEVFSKLKNSWFLKTALEYPIATLLTSLALMAGLDWAALYATMMLMARSMGLKSGGGTNIIPTDTPDGKGGIKSKLKTFLKKLKTPRGAGAAALVAVVIGGVSYLMSADDEPIDVTDKIKKINAGADAETKAETDKILTKFENERAGFGRILSDTLYGAGGGAATGLIAGGGVGALPGALIGGVMGMVTGVGAVAWDAIDDFNNDIDKIPNELESMLKDEANKLRDKTGRNSRFNLSASDKKKLQAGNDDLIQGIIDGLTTSNIGIDTNIKALEASLAGETTNERRGSSRVYDDYVMLDGKSVRKSQVIKDLEDAKKERLIREEQLIYSRKALELRKGEIQAVKATVEKTNKLNDKVDEVAAEVMAAPPILKDVDKRNANQEIASGGFALNVTNIYNTKGGDTMYKTTSDNRVSSQNSTNAVVVGGPGGRWAGGTGLPTGQMA